MKLALLIAIAIHAAVLLLARPSLRVQIETEPGTRLDVSLAPGVPAPKSAPARTSRAPSQVAARTRAPAHTAQPAPTTAAMHATEAGEKTRQAEQTPVMTAHTDEPPAPTGADASSETQAGGGGARLPGGGPLAVESLDRDSAGGKEQMGADDTAAILSYVNKLTRAMRQTKQGGIANPLRRQVLVQIALDRGAPSVRVLGSSDIREFDQLSVAAADRALVAVKPPVDLFDKRFRFSVCMTFNAVDGDYSFREGDVRPGQRDRDGVLDLYFEHGVRCETAVAVDERSEEAKVARLDPGLARYRDELLAEVRKLWFYPTAAHGRRRDERDLEGTVAVQIASEGGVPAARAPYSATNRYPELNDAAELIARHAIASVTVPDELQGKPFRFEVSIEFKPADL